MTERKFGIWFHIFDVVLNIAIILAIVGLIRTFLVSPFQVEGNSMLSTLEHKEYIVINKLAYYIGEPERGDIVVFRPPTDQSKHYVKRIIGLPGDTVVIEDGYVNLKRQEDETEVKLNEEYLNQRNYGHTYNHPPSSGNTERKEYLIPEGEYFLMGDNRQGSLDSRSFASTGEGATPFIPKKNINGRVWFVALPVTKIHAIEPPIYHFDS